MLCTRVSNKCDSVLCSIWVPLLKPVGGVPCFQNVRNPKPQTRILSLTGLFQEPEDLRELCCNAGALDRSTPCVPTLGVRVLRYYRGLNSYLYFLGGSTIILV